MLESMISNPVPTRAEITDVANAVYEQADAVMLSGETTTGRYPVECVRVLDKVARRIELSGGAGYAREALLAEDREKAVHSAVILAGSFPDAKIIIFTRRGQMANFVSNQRPSHRPIHAFAPTYEVCRRLALNWGVSAHCLAFDPNPARTVGAAINHLIASGHAQSGDHLVVVSDILAGEERVHSIQLRIVP
jgi:pyruvate kinase